MFLDLRQKQTLTQKLVMTPQLQQAIKLLQLSRVELVETVRQELAENPALEEVAESKTEDRLEDLTALKDYLNPYEYGSKGMREAEGKEYNSFETYTARRETLTEHILQQLLMTSPTAGEEKIGSLIAGSLNKDGYLTVPVDEISAMSNCTTQKAERILALMQSFDPPGVCARDLRECLLLQIERQGTANPLTKDIISSHLEQLAKQDFREIAKALRVKPADVIPAVKLIKSLEPRPGRQFGDEPPQYIEPDIFVFKIKDEFVISLNNSGLPLLRISTFFKEALKNGNKITGEANDYLREKLRSARWLIRSIQERQRTIYRVMESILKFQRGFFEKGVSLLKPMVLRNVAESIDMAESTVSRVTANKYAHTPQGIFELKYFFTSGVGSRHGGQVSSTVVQEKIRRIVAAEDPQRPMSDDRIARILQAEGIDIARRTVAKYRENIGILASSRRKQFKYY
ncbi:MAG: RNA polymerase factor sigma-54 [Deltaproteobacteria bacterium]